MTAYTRSSPLTHSQAVQEAKEKRKQVLEAVRKRRGIIYQRFQEKVRTQERIRLSGIA